MPPPGTMPSSRAARVACSASSTRCFFSFISVSVAAPTLTTATPPASFARRSCSFSRSKSESVFSISFLIWSMRPLMALGITGAVDDRGVVLCHDDATGAAELRELRVLELEAHLLGDHLAASEDRDVLEHALAAIAEARRLDRDAGEGAAELVHDEVARASPSTSSAMISSGLPDWMTCSSTGSMSRTEPIFWFAMRMYGSSSTASMRSWSVTMYGEM